MDEDEVCLLAVMLALGLHPGLASWDVGTTVPFLEKTVHQTSHALFRTLLKSTGLDLTRIQGALPMLERLLTPLALRARYGLDGCQSTENLHDSIYFRSPLGVSYARMMATEAERLLKCKTSVEDLVSFACYISTLLWQVEYPIRSMRLILVDLEQSAFGDVVGRALMERWPEYIRSITPLALYEVRGLKESDYDGVLLGYSWRNRAIASYRYTAPAVPMAMIYQDRSFQQVYNDLLTYAFQLEEVIPQEAAFHVYDDFTYYDADQALQLLAARSARDAGCEATLLAGLRQRERLLTMARPGVAVVCAERALCREERFDIYRLKKGGEWNGTPIGTILFATLTGMRPDRLKALAAVLEELSQAPDQIEAFAERPRPAFEEILRRSVRTAPEKSAQVL